MTVAENSYALDDISFPEKGMSVIFGGDDTCKSLRVESEKDGHMYS